MRKVLFWMHLTAGVTAGIIILTMCVTGVALTYEKQVNTWLERPAINITPPPGAARLPLESLITRVKEQQTGLPTAATVHPGAADPVEVSLGRAGTIYANPYTGEVLAKSQAALPGDANQSRARSFFRIMEDTHRWLGATGPNRSTGKSIMDAANLIFFGMVLSGLFLWMPRKLNWQTIRPSVWFRGGLAGKARDWNWHNVIGIWLWVPLVLVVGSGVVMSYPWASNLLYTVTRSPLPPQPGAGGRGPGPGGPGFPGGFGGGAPAPANWKGLDLALNKAEQQVSGWKSIRVQGSPNANAPFNFSIDRGDGGQPQLRSTLTVDRQGQVKNYADFSSNSTGAQLRQLARFTHTGESLGVLGQTIAGLGAAGGALMVYTGLALSLRRLWAWRKRRSQPAEQEVAAEAVEA